MLRTRFKIPRPHLGNWTWTLNLARLQPRCGARQLLHARQFSRQTPAPFGRQAVGLLLSGGVGLVEAFDPAVLEEPAKRAVEGPRANADAAAAERLDVLDERVSVSRLPREAGEDQED